MRILIICHYFPPLNSVASLRPYAYARYWSEKGHEVTVLTTDKKERGDFLPAINTYVVQQNYFGQSAIKVVKNDYVGNGIGTLKKKKNRAYFRNTLVRGILWLRSNFGIFAAERMPEIIFPWYFVGKRYLRENVHKFDVVVAEYSPPVALMLGSYAKKLAGKDIKFIMDYRDSWTVSNYSQPGMPGFRWVEKIIENSAIKRADLICCAQSGIAKEFIDRGVSSVAVIENGFFDDIPEAKEEIEFSEIGLVYTGSYGGYRNLDFLQEALDVIEKREPKLFSKITIYILGNGSTKCNHPKIKILGKLDYAQSLLFQKMSSILLIVESSQEIAKFNIPGKFFEYFRYKKPIIVFGPKKSFEIAKYLRENEIGIVADATPEAAADAILHVLENMPMYSGKNLERYSRKSKALEFLSLIEEL